SPSRSPILSAAGLLSCAMMELFGCSEFRSTWKNGGNCKEYRNHRNRLKGVAYSMGFGHNNNASFLSYFLLPISVQPKHTILQLGVPLSLEPKRTQSPNLIFCFLLLLMPAVLGVARSRLSLETCVSFSSAGALPFTGTEF